MTATLILGLAAFSGCQSPYHSDQMALGGGLLGAGLGAIVGNQSGNAAAGAAIGAIAGTVTGAVVGNEVDEAEARNRAIIERQMGRPVSPGAVTVGEIIELHRAGVAEPVLITHVQKNGLRTPIGTNELLQLQQEGVSPAVIQTMQMTPPPMVAQPTPVIVEERYYGPPVVYGHPYYYHHHHCRGPRAGWSVAVGH